MADVRQLRVRVTAPDYDEALRFYRDVLGLTVREAYGERGRVTILDAGRATLELLDEEHAAFVDEVEVGRRVAGHVRLAFEVDDAATLTRELEAAGAEVVAPPTRTPWESLNARLEGPAGPSSRSSRKGRSGPDPVEIRLLGCLIEKQRTTPDVYPLSLNSLRLAATSPRTATRSWTSTSPPSATPSAARRPRLGRASRAGRLARDQVPAPADDALSLLRPSSPSSPCSCSAARRPRAS